MSEIGAMVIKLQAQTAEFRDDMGKVKADLDGLKGSAGKAGEAMDHSMTDSRESVMLLGEEVGVHMPRALSMFVSKLPGVGAAMEMAFPIIGIVAVIGIIGKLIEAHEKAKQAMAALPDQELKIGTAFAESMNKWKSKSDEAAAKIDELKGDHLGALQLRLKALNEQNLNELVGQFSKLDTVAQKVFLTLKAGMLEFGHGSEGAKDALGEFTTKYENLMALGKTDQAESLLAGTLADAKKYLAIQEQLRSHPAAYNEDAVAFARLNKVAVDSSDKAYQSQQELVDILQKKIALQNQETKTTHDEGAAMSLEEEDKWAIKLKRDHGELRKAREEAAKEAERENEELVNSQQVVANLMAESARKQAKENVKLAESYDAIAQARTKGAAESAKSSVQSQASLGLITKQQEAQKLLAIDQQELTDYKKTQDAKLQALRDYASETASIAQQAKGTNQQEATQSTATQAQIAYNNAVKQGVTDTQQLNDKLTQQNTQLQKLNPSFQQIIGQMRNELPSAALQMQNSMTKAFDGVSQGIAKSLVEGKNLGSEMRVVVRQMAEQWIEYAIKRMLMDRLVTASHITGNATAAASDKTTGAMSQLAAAKAGAAKAYQAMAGIPIIGPELGAIAGALAFATMMAFEKGGKIPGAGAVPIIGHGGETVVTKALTDRVERSESHSMTNNGGATHVHANFAPQIHAVDAEGVDRVLTKHGALFQRHLASTIRRMNR